MAGRTDERPVAYGAFDGNGPDDRPLLGSDPRLYRFLRHSDRQRSEGPHPTTGLPTGKQPTAAVAHRPCEPAVAGYDSRRYDRYRQKTDSPTPGRGRFRIGGHYKETTAYSLRTRFSTKRPASPTGARHTGRYRNRGYGPARPHIAAQRRQGTIDRPARRPDSVRRLPPERP